MSDIVLVALITGLCSGIPAMLGVYVSLRNGRKADEIRAATHEIKVATDGMQDALVKATKGEATAHGLAAGVEQERNRQASVSGDIGAPLERTFEPRKP